ncbi:hypothetical protein J4441_04760 [Candidatus Micrarchaeota archaeon]|nr:hypothetical protein [Candidatus Micrarchaeota archaeon]
MAEMKSVPKGVQAKASKNYVAQYKRVIKDVVAACGGDDGKANRMIEELNEEYKKGAKELEKLESRYEGDTNSFGYKRDRERLMVGLRHEMNAIIERYVPHAGDKTHDLFVGASLAIAAVTLPFAVPTITIFSIATGLIAAGGTYLAGYNVVKSWPALATKANVRDMIAQTGGKIRIGKR